MTTLDHAARRLGIGGSDIGAIAGLCPFKSAFDVWLEKTGQREPRGDTAASYWGKALEDVVARRYSEETGHELTIGSQMVHPERDWHRGNPDRLAAAVCHLIEIKAAGIRQAHRWGEPGTDEIPEEYLAQVQWYLALLPGYEVADIPVLIAGNDYRVYTVARNERLIGALVEIGERWWRDHVVGGKPPAIDGSEAAREYLARRYPRELAPLLQSTPAIEEIAQRLRAAKERRAQAAVEEELAGNELRALIGEAEGIGGEWGRVTWKAQSRTTTDWRAVAEAAGATEDDIKQSTTTTTIRVLRTRFAKEQ